MFMVCAACCTMFTMGMPDWEPPNKELAPPKHGEPPLHRAAREGDHKTIRELVKSGANVNAVFDLALDPGARDCPATPLMVAAGSGDGASVETVKLLLELGADCKIRLNCMTAADFAARGLGWNYKPGGDAPRLKLLLDAGSPLDIDGPVGSRLVARIAGLGDPGRLAIVLKLGAPANALWERDPEDHAHMLESIDEAGSELFKDLTDEVTEELRAEMRKSTEEFLKKAESAPYPHEIPLFKAVESGSIECVKMLVAAGADIKQRDNQRQTALWYCGSGDVARLLIKRGLSLEDTDEYGWTPLVGNLGTPERTKILIDAGANVNASHDRGFTVFMNAVSGMERNLETMKMLVAAGADPHAVSELGFNAFHAAIDVNGEANEEKSVRETFGYLKQLKVDMELRNRGGRTPLARAVESGTLTEVRVLCDLGANPNADVPVRISNSPKATKETLIFLAIDSAPLDADEKVVALVKAGAKTGVKNSKGQSPVDFAKAKLEDYEDYESDDLKEDLIRQMRACIQFLSKL